MGFFDDFKKGRDQGRENQEDRPPVELAKVGTWRAKQWLLATVAGILGLWLILVIVSNLPEDGPSEEEIAAGTFDPADGIQQPDGIIRCPGQLFVALPDSLKIRIDNPGTADYPKSFVALEDGFDSFTLNGIESRGKTLPPVDDFPGFDRTYDAGPIPARGSRSIEIALTPIEAGNITLSVWSWTDEGEGEGFVPDNPAIFECPDVPVNP